MRSCTSPLEDLAAFAIAFFCGALSVITLSSYVRSTKKPNTMLMNEGRDDDNDHIGAHTALSTLQIGIRNRKRHRQRRLPNDPPVAQNAEPTASNLAVWPGVSSAPWAPLPERQAPHRALGPAWNWGWS